MRKVIVFAALVLLARQVKAGELALPGLAGMSADAAAPVAEVDIQRPDSKKVLAGLTAELRLSAKQEKRITAAVDRKGKDFDKLLKEYDDAATEEKKWGYRANELKHDMGRINKDIPDAIRDLLDADQRQTYDALLAAKNKPAAPVALPAGAPETKIEAAPAKAAGEVVKPVRKRRVVRRKKIKAGSEAAGAQAPIAAPPAAGGAPIMDTAASEPAGAKPTGKEAPGDAAQDAGSYP